MPRIDVIVAVRNEEAALPGFLDELAAVPLPDDVTLRVLAVEDSSTDGTREILRERAARNPAFGYYCLERGFGQGPAVVFGLSRSDADAMVMLDADGSHPVAALPELVRAWRGGARVAQCVRRTLPQRRLYRKLGAALYYALARAVTGGDLRQQNTYYRLVGADAAREILARPSTWRWLRFPLPRHPEGATVFVEVDMVERTRGQSKYGPLRLVNLAVDGMLSMIPGSRLALLAGAGVAALALALALSAWPVALLLAAVGAWVGLRRARLAQPDLLERMRVVESANAP